MGQGLISLVHDYAEDAAKSHLNSFKAVYQVPEKSPTGLSTVYLDGPRELIEHGSLILLFDEKASWRLKSWKFDPDGMTELRGSRKLAVVRKVFHQVATDTSFYLDNRRVHRARLLTDLPGEVYLLNWLTEDENLSEAATAMTALMHSVPLLADLSLATIMRIRKEERDSFESYRTAVARITSEILRTNMLSKKDATEMFKQQIEPAVARLTREMRNERHRQAKRVVGGLATVAAGIALGVFGGLPPVLSGPIAVAAAAAGGRLLGKAGEVACEHGSNLRQHNDFYFLARLVQES